MNAERKSVSCEFKARKGSGEFEAEFSVYGNVDLDGDRILKGALEPAIESNPNPPIVWTHLWEIPPIGETLEAKSTDSGGTAIGRLFVEDHEVAKQVYAGLKSNALKEYSFSFGEFEYNLVGAEGAKTPRSDGMVREIPSIKQLHEWGPTLKGANPATSTLSKSAALKLLGLTPEAAKAYGDIDSWEITCLTNMLDYGTSFIVSEADPEDVATMKAILSDVLGLLSKEMAEEPDENVTLYLNHLARTLKGVKGTSKAGARHSADDLKRIQSIHELTSELLATPENSDQQYPGADDGDKNAPNGADVAKLLQSRPMLHLHSRTV